jgi:hypothetical protein
MKTMPNTFQSLLFCLFLSSLAMGCRKESYHVSVDIDVRDPVITTLADGSRQLDFTIVVTQLGNYFFRDFMFELKPFAGGTAIDTFSTQLPTAREFVFRTVVVPGAGNYFVNTMVGSETNGASGGEMVVVP